MKRLIALLTLVLSVSVAGVAFPAAAGAQGNEPLPPPNDNGCNGLVVAYGDHPAASPAVGAREIGMSVRDTIIFVRDMDNCALQK